MSEDENRFFKMGRQLRQTFEEAGSEISAAAKETTDELRDGINMGRKAIGDAYGYVENTVGRDRLAGAAIGAKIGGLLGVPGGLVGATVLGTVGTVVGFAAGRSLYNWLEAGRANDNAPEDQTAPKPGPDDPSPKP